MGHKNIALCIVLVLTSSCAVGWRTHQTYASDPDGTATKIGGGEERVKSDDGKVAEKDSTPKAFKTGESRELFAAFARDTHSMDNAETSIEKRTPFVEDGHAEMVGNPYGYGAAAYDPIYAAAAAYTQSQMPAATSSAKATTPSDNATADLANAKADEALAAQALNAEEIAKLKKDKKKSK